MQACKEDRWRSSQYSAKHSYELLKWKNKLVGCFLIIWVSLITVKYCGRTLYVPLLVARLGRWNLLVRSSQSSGTFKNCVCPQDSAFDFWSAMKCIASATHSCHHEVCSSAMPSPLWWVETMSYSKVSSPKVHLWVILSQRYKNKEQVQMAMEQLLQEAHFLPSSHS